MTGGKKGFTSEQIIGKSFESQRIIDSGSLLNNRSYGRDLLLSQIYNLFIMRRVPDHIRSDNGAEFAVRAVREFLARVRVKPLFIEPSSPWEKQRHKS